MNTRQLLACTLAFAVAGPAAGASLTLLPDWFGNPTVDNLWMLPDGKTISGIDGTDVFRWNPSTGRTIFGTMPESIDSQTFRATDISDDGSTIIGYLGNDQFQPLGGFVWTAAGGAIVMPSSADGTSIRAVPTALSSDGRAIVGNEYQPTDPWGYHVDVKGGFRWTADTGTVPLDGVQFPEAISDDGSVVVGSGPVGEFTTQAVRWTEATGAIGLGILPNSWQPVTVANFVSADGAAVIGYGFPPDARIGPKAFRWTDQTGLEQLSTLGDVQGVFGIADDANVVVGNMGTLRNDVPGFATKIDAFVWTSDAGLQKLSQLLALHGLDDEYPLYEPNKSHSVNAISADGRVIFGTSTLAVGGGTFTDPIPKFYYEHWLLDLSVAPEPSSWLLAALGLAPILLHRHRRSDSAP